MQFAELLLLVGIPVSLILSTLRWLFGKVAAR